MELRPRRRPLMCRIVDCVMYITVKITYTAPGDAAFTCVGLGDGMV